MARTQNSPRNTTTNVNITNDFINNPNTRFKNMYFKHIFIIKTIWMLILVINSKIRSMMYSSSSLNLLECIIDYLNRNINKINFNSYISHKIKCIIGVISLYKEIINSFIYPQKYIIKK